MWACEQVKALEAAEAARRKEVARAAERARQRAALEQQRADRLKRAGDARVPPRPRRQFRPSRFSFTFMDPAVGHFGECHLLGQSNAGSVICCESNNSLLKSSTCAMPVQARVEEDARARAEEATAREEARRKAHDEATARKCAVATHPRTESGWSEHRLGRGFQSMTLFRYSSMHNVSILLIPTTA